MKKELILVDTSWVLHKMWHVHKDLQVTLHNGEVIKTGHVYGMCRLAKSLTTKYPEAEIIFCLDGLAENGKSINEEYKANRGNSPARAAFDDIGVISKCLLVYPRTKISYHPRLEADEVIAFHTRYNEKEYEKIIVYSADGDMLQLLDQMNVFIAKEFNKDGTLNLVGRNEYFSDPKYNEKFVGVNPTLLPLYRAIVGDSSDNLKGFPRIRKRLAKEIVENFKTLDEIVFECERAHPLFPFGFDDFIFTFIDNYKIMRLPTPDDIFKRLKMSPISIYGGEVDNAKKIYCLYRLKSVSPVGYEEVLAEVETAYLEVRDSVNKDWSSRLKEF